jgi:dipeptidyl aminopeptidase/acylaminoacyl peptidase
MNTRVQGLAAALVCGSFALAAGQPSFAAGKPGGGGGTTLSPNIVYMSRDNRGITTAAEIRGSVLSADGRTATDVSLVKSATGREHTSIAWSPDGSRFAWVENGKIMAAAPGKAPVVLYSTVAGDKKPTVGGDFDGLAWGPGCVASTSVIAFRSFQPYGVFVITVDANGAVTGPRTLATLDGDGRLGAMAFSPTGRYLALEGFGSPLLGAGIHLMPTCDEAPAVLLVDYTNLHGEVASIDWSPAGNRLALTVVKDPGSATPWRDLEIVYLNYSRDATGEVVSFVGTQLIDLDPVFGADSTEQSPSWGPAASTDNCQRLAFSQSADRTGRNLYLLDIGPPGASGTCSINTPLRLTAKNPRALDWK